jgi:hypothetical protein
VAVDAHAETQATDVDAGVGPWSDALVPAVEAWVVARVVIFGALGFARYVVDHAGHLRAGVVSAAHAGLLSWDGAWYSDIATKGYDALPREALRFFPGVPLAARGLGFVGIDERPALVLISNASALVAGVLLYRFVVSEGWGREQAVRSVWLLALAPPAFVFAMGYTDATVVALAIATLYALRRRAWWWAAVFGLVAGVCRPTAVLLALPALVEALRAVRTTAWKERVARAAAVLAAPAGLACYLVWVGRTYGDALLPFRVQTASHLRGHLTDPASALWHGVRAAFDGHLGSALHLPWALLLVALTVVVVRTQPRSCAALTIAVVLAGLTADNLDSMERYALLAFPLVIAAAGLLRSRTVERAVFVLAGVAMFGYAVLAFLGLIGP